MQSQRPLEPQDGRSRRATLYANFQFIHLRPSRRCTQIPSLLQVHYSIMNGGSNISSAGHSAQRTTVHIDQRYQGARIGWVTIDNQRKLNTLNSALMEEFIAAMEALRDDASLRAVV